MPADTTGKVLQVLDLMLDFFADDDHWTRGRYHDPHGRHCLVGAVFYFSAKHGLPRAPVMSLLSRIAPTADRADRFQRSSLPQHG
jgi:hypothetical protein